MSCYAPAEAAPSATRRDEDLAAKLQQEGNELFVRKSYADALDRYRGALAAWDHAKLHLAAGLAYMKLSRWVEAAEHFERALARPDELDADLDKARNNLAAALANTGVAAIRNAQAGVVITLDGRRVELIDHAAQCRVTPGPHVVVARRGALETDTRNFEVAPGGRTEVAPVVYTIETRWRWARWKPWSVVGVGGAIAIAGLPLALDARERLADYDRRARDACRQNGCPPDTIPADVEALRTSASTRERLAIGAFLAGGVVVAAGVALVGLNRPETRKVVAPEAEPRVVVAPWLGGRGVVATLSF